MQTFSVASNLHPVSSFQPRLSNLSARRRKDVDALLPLPLPLPSHVELITSPSNPFVKHCVKLRQSSSYRHSHAYALVVGSTPIREITRFQDIVEERPSIFHCLLLLDGAEVPQELADTFLRIVRVSSMVMKKLSGMQSIDSTEAVALLKIPNSFCHADTKDKEENFRSWFPCPHRILVLDGIQDPGNLGTLLRSAAAFRWDGVFLLPGCCDPFNEKALRASRGTCFQLPIVSGNWDHLKVLRDGFEMKMLAGHPSYDDNTDKSLKEVAERLVDKHVCLVLGSEGLGLSEKSQKVCELVSIHMAGEYESLNVSVAGGIFMFMLQSKNDISN